MNSTWFIAVILACVTQRGRLDDPREHNRAVVRVEVLDIFDAPAPEAYATGRLREGDVVTLRNELPDGWAAIEPPAGSFEWIDAAALELRDDGTAIVNSPRASLRVGRAGARMPGPPSVVLERGAAVRLADQPDLSLRQGRSTRTWRAIEPPEGSIRYVRAEGLDVTNGTVRAAGTPASTAPRLRLEPGLVALGPRIPTSGLSAPQRDNLDRLENEHRRVLRRPIAEWELGRVAAGYRSLEDQVADPEGRQGLQARLDHVERQTRSAAAARRLYEALSRSRERDARLSPSQDPRDASKSAEDDAPFEAEGLLQPSSKLVEGERVYALIGPEGRAVAYLRPLPGIVRPKLIGSRVGVRGVARYNETLRAEVIRVDAIEALTGPP